MNLAGIIGPAIGGLLIPLVGVSGVFAMNAAGIHPRARCGKYLETQNRSD